MATSATKARWVRCPSCGMQAPYSADNPSRPFCSARCRNADFGDWASENYRVESDKRSEADGDDPVRGIPH